ncbi:hypothetical protein V1478_013108 [Vespula squamosa]|uniref:Uncharacterized protein n=1 Tax=Vespula squamosa TaxID=30214 RepID=A0ABD2A9V9_VESSQ
MTRRLQAHDCSTDCSVARAHVTCVGVAGHWWGKCQGDWVWFLPIPPCFRYRLEETFTASNMAYKLDTKSDEEKSSIVGNIKSYPFM